MNVFCPNCGGENRSGAAFCRVCGNPLPSSSPLAPVPSQPSSPSPASQLSPTSGSGAVILPSLPAELVMPDGRKLALEAITVVGREPAQANLAFPDDARLSRCHARIWEQNGQWFLEDMGSRNGTYINNAKVTQPMPLTSSDQIGMGSMVYIFNIIGQPQVSPVSNLPTVAQPNLPQPGFGASLPVSSSQGGWGATPISQAPRGGWRQWNKAPLVEGYARAVSDRYMMKKDDLVKRGIAAAALALFISPALAFLPLMQGNDIAARDIRIEDRFTGRMVDVKMLGDPMGNIAIGDALAVWGQVQGGLLLMEVAYNYATETEIRLKK